MPAKERRNGKKKALPVPVEAAPIVHDPRPAFVDPMTVRGGLLESANRYRQVLDEIASGTVTITLREKCEACGHVPDNPPPVLDELRQAPSPGDRRAAIETMLKFSIGQKDEITVVSPEVRERLRLLVATIRQSPHVANADALLDELAPIFR